MNEHPTESRREWIEGIVIAVHPDWFVDVRLLTGSSSIVRRCKVISHFLPEVSGKNPDGSDNAARQSKVLVGFIDAYQQGPVAIPVHSAIIPSALKQAVVFWSEHLNFRITVDRYGELKISNAMGGTLLQVRIQEAGGVIRIDTPSTHLVHREEDRSITVQCDGDVTVSAGGAVDVHGGSSVTVEAPTINLKGAVSIEGTLDVSGNITSGGMIEDAGGNTNHHSHG